MLLLLVHLEFLLPAPLLGESSRPASPAAPLDWCTTLRLSFEQVGEADCSADSPAIAITLHRKGKIEALTAEQAARFYVPGLVGKGLSNVDRDCELWLALKPGGNLRARSSTILWWRKTLTDKPGNWCGLMLHLGAMFVVAPPGHSPETMMAHAQGPDGERLALAYATFKPKPGEWHQLGLAWDSRSLSLVVDGAYAATEPLRRPLAEGSLNLTFVVAGWGGEDHDVLLLDEATVYNRLLTSAEVKAEYERLKP